MRRGLRILIALIIGVLVTFCTLEIITTNIYQESHSLINSVQSEPNVASVPAKYYTEPTTKNIEHKYTSELSLANNITTQAISSQIPRWLERVRREEEAFTKSFFLIGVSFLSYKEKMYGYTDSTTNTLYDLEPKIFQKSYFEPALLEGLVSLEVIDDVVRHYRMLRRITQTLWMTKFSADSKNPLNYCPLLCKQTHELFENDNVDSYMQIKNDLAHGELQQETMMLVDASYYLVFTFTNLCVNEYQSKLIKDPRLRNIAKQIDVSSNDIGQILQNGRYKKGAERRLLPWETPYLRKKNKN